MPLEAPIVRSEAFSDRPHRKRGGSTESLVASGHNGRLLANLVAIRRR